MVTSNQVQHTDYSGQNWEDCAVRCEATPGCDCWNWNPAYMICRSDTGCYNYSTGECQAPSPLTGLIGGTRGCTAHSSVAGWATCSDTPPYSSLAIYEQEEVICSSSISNVLAESSCRFFIPRRGTSASCSVWSPAGTLTGAQTTPW